MSSRLRLTLAVIGLLLIAASLLALVYAYWPLDTAIQEFSPPPTLFAPPQALHSPTLGGNLVARSNAAKTASQPAGEESCVRAGGRGGRRSPGANSIRRPLRGQSLACFTHQQATL
jgi:hypothetical protein